MGDTDYESNRGKRESEEEMEHGDPLEQGNGRRRLAGGGDRAVSAARRGTARATAGAR